MVPWSATRRNHVTPTGSLRTALRATLLILGAPGALMAQAAPSPPADPLARLEPGAMIRVELRSGTRVTGRFEQVGDGRLGIRSNNGTGDTLRLAELRTLSVRRRHTGTGAIVGGVLGVGFGVFVGWLVNATCEGGRDCSGARPYLLAVPLFGSAGALAGAGVGSIFPRWRRIFP
jgi:hypothetical protein